MPSPSAPAATPGRGRRNTTKRSVDYDEAIRLDPKNVLAFDNRGSAWRAKKEYDKAIKDYDEAIRLDPDVALVFNNRGSAWNDKKDYDTAIKDFDEAIRLTPVRLRVLQSSQRMEGQEGVQQGFKDYDEAIRLDPKLAEAHLNRSVTLMLTRRPKAANGFQAVLRIQGWKGNRSLYAVLLGHFAARQAGDEPTAKRFLNDLRREARRRLALPGGPAFLRGEIDEVALLKLAVDDGKRTEAHCFLGLDHALNGRKEEAMTHFRWVKDHGTVAFIEYTIALAELERLERGEK